MPPTAHRLAAGMAPATLVLALAVAGCRGAPDAFSAVDLPLSGGDTVRLTYSISDDRSPTWRGPDTVMYAAGAFEGAAQWQGFVAALPRQGGTFRPIMAQLYAPGITRWLATPVSSPAGDRVAYASLDVVNPGVLCPNTRAAVIPNGSPGRPDSLPPLVSARIVVRDVNAITGEALDPQAAIAFASLERKTAAELPIPTIPAEVARWLVRFYPFQNDFANGGPLAFRPTFSPSGGRVAFSDGLRLFTWKLQDNALAALPRGDSLVSAAWSPTGNWIAASRPSIADSSVLYLRYINEADVAVCAERRVTYEAPTGTLVLVAPDGSTRRELGEGVEPAWAPDGSAVYVRRPLDNAIWRVPLAGGESAVRIPGTTGGAEPALSPDGRFLAFTRLTSPGNRDVYVIRLAP